MVLLGAIVPVAFAVAVFANTLGNGWVLDDHHQIIRNRMIQEPRFYTRALTSDVWCFIDVLNRPASNYWRPTFVLWNIANFRAFGLESPAPWHGGNIALHAVATLLLYVLSIRLGLRPALSCAIAVIFAAHPTRPESVAWISGSTDLLLGVWVFSSLVFAHMAMSARARWASIALGGVSLMAYALALGSKESAVLLPVVIGVLAWHVGPQPGDGAHGGVAHAIPRSRLSRTFAWTSLFLLVGVGWFLVRHSILGELMKPNHDYTLGQRIASLPNIAVWYARQSLLPTRILPVYVLDIVSPPRLPLGSFWLPLLVCVLTGAAMLLWWRFVGRMAGRTEPARSSTDRDATETQDWRSICLVTRVGGSLACVVLLPAMNIAAYGADQPVHDRYLYVPLAGVLLVLVPGAWVVLSRLRALEAPRAGRAVLAGALAAALAMGQYTARLGPMWVTERTVWEWGARMDPRLVMCWNVLCELAADEQRFDEALRCAEMADRCPQNSGSVSRTETLRASIALETGDPAVAARTYERLLKLYSRNAWPVALVWTKIALASAYDKMGRQDDAERLLRETLSTDPNIAPLVGEKLAVFLRHHKRAAEARAELEKVLPLADRSYLNGAQMVYYRLGLLDWEDKRYDIARVRLRRFLNTTVGQTDRELKRHRDFAIKVLGKMDAAPVSPAKP